MREGEGTTHSHVGDWMVRLQLAHSYNCVLYGIRNNAVFSTELNIVVAQSIFSLN